MSAGWVTDKESRSGTEWPQEMRVSDQPMAPQESAERRNLAVVSEVQYNYCVCDRFGTEYVARDQDRPW